METLQPLKSSIAYAKGPSGKQKSVKFDRVEIKSNRDLETTLFEDEKISLKTLYGDLIKGNKEIETVAVNQVNFEKMLRPFGNNITIYLNDIEEHVGVIDSTLEYTATHDYVQRTENEMSISKGQTVKIFKEQGSWIFGACEGQTGWIPKSFVSSN
jgi:hypothetical protein